MGLQHWGVSLFQMLLLHFIMNEWRKCVVYGKRRCERSAFFLIIPRSPWCYYFCAMMQATSFIYVVGKKITALRLLIVQTQKFSTCQDAMSSVSFTLLMLIDLSPKQNNLSNIGQNLTERSNLILRLEIKFRWPFLLYIFILHKATSRNMWLC